jgi:hypothetical protein
MTAFYYMSGEVVREGDIVTVINKLAVVERILSERSQDARDFACFNTGGLVLRFDDGDLQVWRSVDEDLEFLRRKNDGL